MKDKNLFLFDPLSYETQVENELHRTEFTKPVDL